jgi:hypothetical protein
MGDLPPSQNGKPKRWPVVAKMDGSRIVMLAEPEYTSAYLAGDVVEDSGRLWCWEWNHNGQALRGRDVTNDYIMQHEPQLAAQRDYDATVEPLGREL